MTSSLLSPDYATAAQFLADAEALLIGAGAGMGVDSGLPAFHGTQGFWSAYPAYQGRSFAEMACPETFTADPELAWGFYGHRLNRYRQHLPHAGFDILRCWAESIPHGYFVMTSNVDGHFQRAGFAPEPRCPHCGALARPNLLMFYDGDWRRARFEAQHRRYKTWLRTVQERRLVVIELGAGTTIATVRRECEYVAWRLIRINPHDTEPPAQGVLLPVGALEGLTALDAAMRLKSPTTGLTGVLPTDPSLGSGLTGKTALRPASGDQRGHD